MTLDSKLKLLFKIICKDVKVNPVTFNNTSYYKDNNLTILYSNIDNFEILNITKDVIFSIYKTKDYNLYNLKMTIPSLKFDTVIENLKNHPNFYDTKVPTNLYIEGKDRLPIDIKNENTSIPLSIELNSLDNLSTFFKHYLN